MKNLPLLLTILLLISCTQTTPTTNSDTTETKTPQSPTTFPTPKKLSAYQSTTFLPTPQHKIQQSKNAIYCVTLLYAWDEIRKEIKLPLQIDKKWQDLTLLDRSESFVNVLKPGEYTTSVEIKGLDIIAKAEFNKSLPFEFQLSSFEDLLTFEGTKVASFGSFGSSEAADAVMDILYYKDDNEFVMQLLSKDKSHKIILFKSEQEFETMAEMFAQVEAKTELGNGERKKDQLNWKYYLEDEDEVVIPKFLFNIETDYDQLVGNEFQAKEESYTITKAWQRTAFVLDEAGAELESVSEMVATTEAPVMEMHPKKMRFDKPFFLMLKRTDSKNPYFGMWVANAELMVKE